MKQAKVLNEAEIKRLFRVVSTTKHGTRNRAIVMLSYLAGLRACEIATLKIGDVLSVVDGQHEIKEEIRLDANQTKGGKKQTVIVNEQLQKEIGAFYQSRRNTSNIKEHLFLSQKRSAFSSQSIQNLFRSLYDAAGIEDASSHSGRRTFITKLSESGISTRVIQELARHSSMATTQRYIDVSTDKLHTAVNLVQL